MAQHTVDAIRRGLTYWCSHTRPHSVATGDFTIITIPFNAINILDFKLLP